MQYKRREFYAGCLGISSKKPRPGKPSSPDTHWTSWEQKRKAGVFGRLAVPSFAEGPPAPPLQGPSPMLGHGVSHTSECYGGVERWETIRGLSGTAQPKIPPPPRPTYSIYKRGGGRSSALPPREGNRDSASAQSPARGVFFVLPPPPLPPPSPPIKPFLPGTFTCSLSENHAKIHRVLSRMETLLSCIAGSAGNPPHKSPKLSSRAPIGFPLRKWLYCCAQARDAACVAAGVGVSWRGGGADLSAVASHAGRAVPGGVDGRGDSEAGMAGLQIWGFELPISRSAFTFQPELGIL